MAERESRERLIEEEEGVGHDMRPSAESEEEPEAWKPKRFSQPKAKKEPSVTTFRTGRSCKVSCGYVVCTVMLVLIAIVLSASVGLFVGQSLGRQAVRNGDGGGTTAPPPSGGTTPTPPPPGGYNWGDMVTISGRPHSVLEYFIANINTTDIKQYLQ